MIRARIACLTYTILHPSRETSCVVVGYDNQLGYQEPGNKNSEMQVRHDWGGREWTVELDVENGQDLHLMVADGPGVDER